MNGSADYMFYSGVGWVASAPKHWNQSFDRTLGYVITPFLPSFLPSFLP